MLFSNEYSPVSLTSQKRVPVPEGLDLDTWLYPLESYNEIEIEDHQSRPKKTPIVSTPPPNSTNNKYYLGSINQNVEKVSEVPSELSGDIIPEHFDFPSVLHRPSPKKYTVMLAEELEVFCLINCSLFLLLRNWVNHN